MLDMLKKSVLAGIGAVVVTKDKVLEATRRFSEEGKISTEEAERLAEDLIKSGERQWEELSAGIGERMRKWSDSLDFAKDREVKELKARLEILEQRVSALEEHCREKQEASGE